MAGNKVANDPAITPIEQGRVGYEALTLSEYDTVTIPQIIGNVEVAGALYSYASLDTIDGLAGIAVDTTDIYIKHVPDVSGDTITATATVTIPVWDEEKQGWYSPTVSEETHRYAPYKLSKDSGGDYINKRQFINVSRTDEVTIDGYLNVRLKSDSSYRIDRQLISHSAVFALLDSFIPNIGQEMSFRGCCTIDTTIDVIIFFQWAKRATATTITIPNIQWFDDRQSSGTVTLSSTDTTTFYRWLAQW